MLLGLLGSGELHPTGGFCVTRPGAIGSKQQSNESCTMALPEEQAPRSPLIEAVRVLLNHWYGRT